GSISGKATPESTALSLCSGSMTLFFLDFGVGVSQLCQIRSPRPGVEFRQQRVISRIRLEFRNVTVGSIDVTEDDRLCWTSGLARGHDLAVTNLPVLFLGGYFRRVDPLDAVSAFFHHAPAAHGHVRVA